MRLRLIASALAVGCVVVGCGTRPADAGPDASISSDSGDEATDAGVVVRDCSGGVEPLPPMKTYQRWYSTLNYGYCGLPAADGQGNIALEVSESDHPAWDLLAPSGTRISGADAWWGALFPATTGFIVEQGNSGGANNAPEIQGIDPGGAQRNHTQVFGRPLLIPSSPGELLAVGPISARFVAPADAQQMVWQLRGDATSLWGPTALALQSRVLGAGSDAAGRVLVIQEGASEFGAGSIAAQWFDRDGSALTRAFQLIPEFRPGPSTWFETSAIAGGLAIRRMDQDTPSALKKSEWVLVLRSGSRRPDPAPEWLRSRPNTDLALLADGRYATLPWGTDVSPCAQAVEILSSSGESCGTLTMEVDSRRCRTRDLRRGLDGTLLQMLPADREDSPVGQPLVHSCTLRFWPGALP
jgi:hypothetical protein